MRSPHNALPNVNLGDDADPAAELGPRLAAASQTVQGLLTNYLFYGQRRARAATTPDEHAAQERQVVDTAEERARSSADNGTTHAAADGRRGILAVSSRRAAAVIDQAGKRDALRASPGSHASDAVDRLAADGLSVDGMQVRTLTLVAADEVQQPHPSSTSRDLSK